RCRQHLGRGYRARTRRARATRRATSQTGAGADASGSRHADVDLVDPNLVGVGVDRAVLAVGPAERVLAGADVVLGLLPRELARPAAALLDVVDVEVQVVVVGLAADAVPEADDAAVGHVDRDFEVALLAVGDGPARGRVRALVRLRAVGRPHRAAVA